MKPSGSWSKLLSLTFQFKTEIFHWDPAEQNPLEVIEESNLKAQKEKIPHTSSPLWGEFVVIVPWH